MENVTVESFGGSPSYVLRLPHRRFPGVLIQGDTLHILVEQLWAAASTLEAGPNEDALDEVREVAQSLQELLHMYEVCLDLEGHTLPYPRD